MKLGAVIAEREYWLATKGRKRKSVHVRFGKPRKDPAGNDYHCVFQIEGLPESEMTRCGFEADSLQALYLTMQMVATELLCTDAYRRKQLTWGGYDDLGLPMDESLRRLVHKDPKAERAMQEIREYLDPEGE